MSATLADKIWRDHVVTRRADGPDLVYIDMHLVHEVTSPQAFEGLRAAGRRVRAPQRTFATEDHIVPTRARDLLQSSGPSRALIEQLRENCAEFGVPLRSLGSDEQGIVHVIAPELGLVLPGMTAVCGDSHTSTLGALGALAFGIGTSEVEQVLSTQTVTMRPFKNMRVVVDGELPVGVTAKDVILAIIAEVGTSGARGHVIEYSGSAIRGLSIEARATVCNMSIEAGARAGLVAPDEITLEYVKGRRYAPTGVNWDAAVSDWQRLYSDDDAAFDKEVRIDGEALAPYVSWGTNPGQSCRIDEVIPDPAAMADAEQAASAVEALEYMGLASGLPMSAIAVDTVFLGSCTNSRIEDLRAAASVLQGRKVAPSIRMLVVPGSDAVRQQAEREGLDKVFQNAGADWRFAGCSMCVGMNGDFLRPGERCASTSNRNFQGRQGAGGRTHLVSPAVAAATAIVGRISAPESSELGYREAAK